MILFAEKHLHPNMVSFYHKTTLGRVDSVTALSVSPKTLFLQTVLLRALKAISHKFRIHIMGSLLKWRIMKRKKKWAHQFFYCPAQSLIEPQINRNCFVGGNFIKYVYDIPIPSLLSDICMRLAFNTHVKDILFMTAFFFFLEKY